MVAKNLDLAKIKLSYILKLQIPHSKNNQNNNKMPITLKKYDLTPEQVVSERGEGFHYSSRKNQPVRQVLGVGEIEGFDVQDSIDLGHFDDRSKPLKYQLLPIIGDRAYEKPMPNYNYLGWGVMCCLVGGIIVLLLAGLGFVTLPDNSSNSSVANARIYASDRAYRQWITSYESNDKEGNGEKNQDLDGDGLRNIDEFVLGSSPIASASCVTIESDYKSFVDFIHPGTCREVDWNNQEEVEKYLGVFVQLPVYKELIDSFNNESTPQTRVITGEMNELTYSAEKIKSYILAQNPTSTLDIDFLVSLLSKHSIDIPYLLAILKYGSNFGEESKTKMNNVSAIGHTSSNDYGFRDYNSSLETTITMIHYLSIRNIPQCQQSLIIFGGDSNSCSIVQEYRENIIKDL